MDEKKTVDGRITKEVTLQQGRAKKYAKLNLAVDSEEHEGETVWYNVTCFGGLAELAAARLKKGDEVRVKGRFSVREYTKGDGSTGTSNDIIADSIILEGGVKLDKFTPAPKLEEHEQNPEQPSGNTPDNDDILF